MNIELLNGTFKIKFPYKSVCIDGRYPSTNYEVGVSIPGADLGDLAGMIAFFNNQDIDIKNDDILDVMLEVVGGLKNFSFHTDEHHSNKDYENYSYDECIGCGHILCELKKPSEYNLTKKDISFLIKTLESLEKEGANNEILYGAHEEEAVLIVNSEKYSIYHTFLDDNKARRQFFVFTPNTIKARHLLIIKKLFQKGLIPKNYNYERVKKDIYSMTQKHLNQTASKLAKGKPLYDVYFDNKGNPYAKYLKKI
ncbi:hypothetical protein [Candidatus Absconditicoccus praedator]|uniref:hypothetical protein n=1 Tax=Candidatus Absconditicoccus praedator TaxID=2735562 RepID=UPI001E4CE1B7|nr:hypothetical protein [Candidatus Absconditicoccus praedator]UFX83012.1 hypothetical protein HLG78_02655 [Candidatus Absconditicoccus praedator]